MVAFAGVVMQIDVVKAFRDHAPPGGLARLGHNRQSRTHSVLIAETAAGTARALAGHSRESTAGQL